MAGDVEEMLDQARAALGRRDVAAGAELLERAAGSGNAEAMLLRANLAYTTRDTETAFEWWGRAGAAGRTKAWRHAAVYATRLGDLDRAAGWWRKLADTGAGEAMYHLAVIALNRDDTAAGTDWLRRAADTGQPDALFTLGHRARESGNLDDARRWWVAAMAAGDANAMAELMALRPSARSSVEEALAAVRSADVAEVYRLARRWNSTQLAAISDHHDTTQDRNEQVLCLHLVLAVPTRLDAGARRFVDDALAIDDADILARWARALAAAHRDGKPHLAADYLDSPYGSPA